MSETKETKPEVTQPVASEGGEMKMKSKPKPKKFKATKEEPVKIDLSKVDTSLEANAKVEAPIKVDLTEKKKQMPFKSEKQRRWMWANKPEMAKSWTLEEQQPLKSPARLLKKLPRWKKSKYKNQ